MVNGDCIKKMEGYKLIILFFLIPIVLSDEVILEVCPPCYLLYVRFPQKEPVFLYDTGELIEPFYAGINITYNSTVKIACPGESNNLLITNTKFVMAKCKGLESFEIHGKQYTLSDLGCKKSVTGHMWKTDTECGNGGNIRLIGHEISPGDRRELFGLCYDESRKQTQYTIHEIFGTAINFGKVSVESIGWLLGGETNIWNDIISTFKDKLNHMNGQESVGKYINLTNTIERGHLSPARDFVYQSSRLSTYFIQNAFPQWRSINRGNWKSLEYYIRNLAFYLQSNLMVITGVHGGLNLDGKNVYTSTDMFQIPQYSWKIVHHRETNTGIAFVTINNPFIKEITGEQKFCKDICEENGWSFGNWKMPEKGFTYCCTVDELKKHIPSLNDLMLHPISVLQGKKTIGIKEIFEE